MCQIALHGAAQTTGTQRNQVLTARLDQVVINTNVTEFIDNHSRVMKPRTAQELAHNGGFTAAQKSRDDR